MLGFASQIKEDGTSQNPFYSFWDTNLYFEPVNLPVIALNETTVCCNQASYNSNIPVLPEQIEFGCTTNRFFFGGNIATINGVYPDGFFETESDLYLNKFSHLDNVCDNENYVMHATFLPGDDTRRTLTDTERSILCELGYSILNTEIICSEDYFTAINDDDVFYSGGDFPFVFDESLIDFILSNDIIGDENFTLEFSESTCNANGVNLEILENNEGLSYIEYAPSGFGTLISICYHITSCGECYDGTIRVFFPPVVPLLPPCGFNSCNPEDNLFCYGDFEAFNTSYSFNYYPQLGLPSCDPFGLWINNSPDVITGGGFNNNFASVYFSNNEILNETLTIPLSTPIQPGCSIDISFLTKTQGLIIHTGSAVLQILGSELLPCSTAGIPNCGETSELGDFVCIADNILSPITINPIPIDIPTWVNNSTIPINFLTIYATTELTTNRFFGIDDIVVTLDCGFPAVPNGLVSITTLGECGNIQFNVENFSPLDISVVWEIDGELLPLTSTEIIYSFAVAGLHNYNVILIEPECGQEFIISGDFFVDILEPINPGFFYTEDCIAGTITISAIDQTGVHNWMFGIEEIESNLPNIIIDLPSSNGEYEIIHSVTNECGLTTTVSDEVIIDYLTTPSGDVLTTIIDNCGNVQFEVNNLSWEDLIIEWNIDGNLFNETLFNYQFSANGTYPYEVILTDPECAQFTTITGNVSVVITEVDAAFTFFLDCISEVIVLSADVSGATHTWTINGNPAPDGAVITVNIINPGTTEDYTIVHTVTNDCNETNTVEMVLTVETCVTAFTCPCEGPNALNIDAGSGTPIMETDLADYIVSTPFGNTLDLTNHCVAISGQLIIGDIAEVNQIDLSLSSGEIKMQPGAEIVITDGARVLFLGNQQIDGSVFTGCDFLWNGITVEEGTSLYIEDYRIEDAQHAICIKDNGGLDVLRTQFNNNFIGIYHSGNGGFLGKMEWCTFDGSGTLLPSLSPNEVSSLSVQSKSYAGIYLNPWLSDNSPPININTCRFSNIPLGLFIHGRPDLIMEDNRFENINPDPSVDYPLEGNAVYFLGETGASLYHTETNSTPLLIPGYFNCNKGIFVNNTDVHISNTHMECNLRGIEVVNSNTGINIQDNIINMSGYGTGISLMHNDAASSLSVKHNNITISSPPNWISGNGRGISVQETRLRPNGQLANIRGNSILMNAGGNQSAGIYLNAVRNMEVRDFNEITCSVASDVGIWLEGIEQCRIENNNITGLNDTNTGNPVGTGLKIKNATFTSYSCNNFYTLNTGAEFQQGLSYDTYFGQNDFVPPMGNGLVYRDMLTINPQEWTANRWLGTSNDYTGVAALNEIVTSDFLDVTDQRLLIFTTSTPYWPVSDALPNYQGNGNPWLALDVNPDQLPNLCYVDNITGNPTKLDERIAAGLNITGAFANNRLWAAERASYKSLQYFDPVSSNLPALILNHIDGFNTTASNGQIGAYHDLGEQLGEVYAQNMEWQTDWKDAWTLKRGFLKEWFSIHQQLNENSTEQTWADYVALLQKITEANADLSNLYDAKQLDMETKIVAAKEDNNLLSTDIIPQDNEKAINAVLLNTILAGKLEFDEETTDLIKSIANQCPLEGGKSVHIARSLYALIDVDYEFNSNCTPVQALISNTNQEDVNDSRISVGKSNSEFFVALKAYPNPVQDELLIEIDHQLNGQLRLLNATGNLLWEKQISENDKINTISTQEIPNGLYYLQFYDQEGNSYSQKIIITH